MIPTSVRVGTRVYEVRSDEETGRLLHDADCRGETYLEQLIIRINQGMPPALIRETVAHESLHAAWNLVGLHKAGSEIANNEEQIISALAPVVVQLLRDNPSLVACLVEA